MHALRARRGSCMVIQLHTGHTSPPVIYRAASSSGNAGFRLGNEIPFDEGVASFKVFDPYKWFIVIAIMACEKGISLSIKEHQYQQGHANAP
eukprot:558340-Pelagomonas_calceolata.AAC.2